MNEEPEVSQGNILHVLGAIAPAAFEDGQHGPVPAKGLSGLCRSGGREVSDLRDHPSLQTRKLEAL